MLSLQRRYLVHKIWRTREISICDQVSAKTFGYLKEAVHKFLASLDLQSLRLLARILTEQLLDSDVCLEVNTAEGKACVQSQRHLIAKVWRWPDLKERCELKHIADSCRSTEMGDCMCVNPFHFSRIAKREIPYRSLRESNKMPFEDSGLSCTSEVRDSSSGTERVCDASRGTKQDRRTKPWVKLAYWELDRRVGTMYHGYDKTINIYESRSKGHRNGLCLKELERTHEMNEPTKVVFRNIGEGVQISLEEGNIWIYNRSQSPVFINGELLEVLHHSETPRVDKLPSGYGLKVFDSNSNVTTRQQLDKRRDEPRGLRVSFVKGFGRGYKRQTIMNCPCWVEMFFFLPKS